MNRPLAEHGFSLVESLVALLLLLVVMSAVFALVNPSSIAAQAQPEVMDVQQRARVAIDAIERDLLNAGAGMTSGPAAGSLAQYFAAIVPRRMGLQGADRYDVARADAITISRLAGGYVQTTLRDPLSSGALALTVDEPANCPVRNGVCGLTQDMRIVVFEPGGLFDWFTIGQLQLPAVALISQQQGPFSSYPAGSFVAHGQRDVYWLDPSARQLRHYDGYLTDVPVVDNVVSLSLEYFGDPQPPRWPRPPPGMPNCLYDSAGNPLPGLVTLAAQGGSLAPLPLAMLGDGPWCGTGDNRFDADLLRVRAVRLSVRVQAAQAVYRGTGTDFASPGSNRSALRAVADYAATLDLTPRNLSLQR
jgi:prepilin-type N-terminal cleavage/methylation domain-containing protein